MQRRKREGLVDGSSKKVESVLIELPTVHRHMRHLLFPETIKNAVRCVGNRRILTFSSTGTTMLAIRGAR